MPGIFRFGRFCRSWRSLLIAALLAVPTVVVAQPRGGAKRVVVEKSRRALVGADAAQASQAAAELGGAGDAAAHAALLDALATGLHPTVAISALNALAVKPAGVDVTTLRAYAAHRVPAVRAAAVRAMGSYSALGAEPGAAILAAFHDSDEQVRASAAQAAAAARVKGASEPLLALLDKGEVAAGLALGAIADADLARVVAEHLGTAPDAVLAQSLAAMLNRSEFGPEPARLQVVRALVKLGGAEVIAALTTYLDATPATPPTLSRREAEAALKSLLGEN